jgi:hypothetical protein
MLFLFGQIQQKNFNNNFMACIIRKVPVLLNVVLLAYFNVMMPITHPDTAIFSRRKRKFDVQMTLERA